MYPFNEYKILRILKAYFSAIKDASSSENQTFKHLFDLLDIDETTRNAFRDIIVNDKIKYTTSYNNLSSEFPVITCIMDQETYIGSEKPIGDILGTDEVSELDNYGREITQKSDSYGYVNMGAYTINIITNQILLTRLIGIFVRFALEHYSNTHDDMYDLDLNTDRFSPDAEYFPKDTFHLHIIVRFRYIESWSEVYNSIFGTIKGITLQTCNSDEIAQYITKPQEVSVELLSNSKISSSE